MDRYEIRCTPEQTKKALELGAPVDTCDWREVDTELKVEGFNEKGWHINYKKPTAQQMIGWLRVKGFKFILSDDIDCNEGNNWWIGFNGELITQGCNDDKELAAIDAALEYLITKR